MPKIEEVQDRKMIEPEPHLVSLWHAKQVATLLKTCKRPVIIFSSQATLRPENLKILTDFATQHNIPSFCSGMARGLFGQSHKNFFRHCRSYALKKADVIILLGCSVDFRLKYGNSFSKSAKIVMINRSKQEGLKNSPLNWKPTVFGLYDSSEFVEKINKIGLNCQNGFTRWNNDLRQLDDEKDQANLKKIAAFTEEHLNPLKLLSCLNQILPENSTIMTDGGDFIGSASYILQPRGPLSWLDPGAYGTLGVGGGFTVAAGLINKQIKKETFLLWGDGSCGFTLTEIDTMVRNKLPVVIIIGNDACWTQIAREQKIMLNSIAACKLEYTRYEQAAVGLGAAGGFLLDCLYDDDGKIKAETDEQQRARITETLQQARRLAQEKSLPVVVNCLIGGTDFRDGSISI